jgi:hypothetical protein
MRRALWLTLLCLSAFSLSWAYVVFYLRGGPRIIDATSYFLEARSLASGAFTFDAVEPSASLRGRFLLLAPGAGALGVIFPPGYPLLLALGVWLGVPMLVGPALAAALVAATYALCRALGQDERVAWTAATLSMLCAALRYHTADTMSHGLATLLGCVALTCALRRDWRPAAAVAGACLGLLVATRPVSALVSLLLVGITLRRAGLRTWATLALAALPGVCLLLLQQRALTGSFFGSTQLAYYAAADAPAGCFRYGFGAGIGCRFEHGDFVARFLPHGYGLAQAARNFVVHLSLFSVDATNAAPLTLLAGFAAFKHRRSALGLVGAGILLQALAYVPFYFDGNYPGGGARFLCEAIPLCQVLVARALVDLRLARFAAPLSLAGFALHARYGHEALREREGGRPMFEPEVVARAGVTRGLVFVDTDHGFNLGHDPRVADASQGIFVARLRKDAHDRQLYENSGRPPSYRYVYDVDGGAGPRLQPYVPEPSVRLEAEAEWPARLLRGSAYPIHFPCASGGRALRLFPGTRAVLGLGSLASAPELLVGWVTTGSAASQVTVSWNGLGKQVFSAEGPGCTSWSFSLPASESRHSLPASTASLHVELVTGEGALDFAAVKAASSVTR